jgi:hypothetical protein
MGRPLAMASTSPALARRIRIDQRTGSCGLRAWSRSPLRAHEIGVRYVLVGSVRRAGVRVRIAAQLIDALSGANLWAERFDRPLQDAFQLQDDIASSVAGVTMEAAEFRRSAHRQEIARDPEH